MATITKKIDTEWFDMILAGRKKFELRLADFDIKEGDTLRLEEWVSDGKDRKPSGRVIEKKIGYIRKFDISDWLKKQPEISQKGMYVLQFDESKSERYKKEEEYGLILLGIVIAIFGGLVVNMISHDFEKYGLRYDGTVAIVFGVGILSFIWLLQKKLNSIN